MSETTGDRSGPVAIIGAGIVGLATAKALERRGISFDIFEPDAPGGGQSRGCSRIFRHESEDPRIARLAADSMEIWRSWEREAGVEMVARTGVVTFGQAAVDRRRQIDRIAPELGLRELEPDDLNRVLPILGDIEGPAVLDPAGGTIWARVALGALFEAVGQHVIPCRVDSIDPLAGGRVAVRAGRIRQEYDAVVVATGVATPDWAARFGVDIPVRRQVGVWITHDVTPEHSGRAMSGIRFLEHGGETASGSPTRGYEGFTVTVHRDLQTEDGVDPRAVEDFAEEIEDWVAGVMPGLIPGRTNTRPCWVTLLPWGLDGVAIWREGPLLFTAGMQMFRLAPLLGEALADAADGGPVREGFRPEDRMGRTRE